MRRNLFFLSLFMVLLTAHLLHSRVLWAEEDLPLAAALQMKRGAHLYRDIWFDKPPLVAGIYLLWSAATGPLLRFAGAFYGLICCVLAYMGAARLWSHREGYIAATLLAFFLTFDTAAAVLPLAADLLLLAPHLAAIYLAWSRRPFWCGIVAGIGFLVNAKAVFVLAACALFLLSIPQLALLLAGFCVVTAASLGWFTAIGSLTPYLDQVWRWPAQYAASPIVSDPLSNGILRTANWFGFHLALALGAGLYLWRERSWRFLAWLILTYAGVALGARFFPRYFFLMLPPLIFMAARGVTRSNPRLIAVLMLATLALPAIRFGPRYLSLTNWNDLALDRDSQRASTLVNSLARPDSTLYVWGYRPEIFVYTGLKPATKFLESQAMTGVPADRHLRYNTVVLTSGTHEARAELSRSKPDIVVDGLGPFNPTLSMNSYSELQPWLAQYREAGRTTGTVIYVRR